MATGLDGVDGNKLDLRRPGLRKTTSYLQQRVSQLDSLDGEVEGDEAETMVLFDLVGVALDDGDATASSSLGSAIAARTEREREGASIAFLSTRVEYDGGRSRRAGAAATSGSVATGEEDGTPVFQKIP